MKELVMIISRDETPSTAMYILVIVARAGEVKTRSI